MPSVNDSTFASQVLSAPLAIAEFWNQSCPNCTRFGPIYDEVASQMAGKILMVTANTDENQQSAAKYGITGIPTTIFFMNGKEVHRAVGAMSKEAFLSEISKSMDLADAAIAAGDAEPAGDVVMGGVALAAVVGGMAYFLSEVA